MPDDILDDQNNDQQQQNNNNNNQQQDNNSLDAMIDSFIEESSNGDNKSKTAGDQNQQDQNNNNNNQQQNRQQQQPNNNQQRQDRPNNQGSNQDRQDQQIPATTRKYGSLFHQDARGNIFNAQGELVAASGNPHKLFRKLWPHIEAAQTEAAGLRSQIEAINNANGAAKAAGLNPQEYAAGISLITLYKKDPREAVKFLLTQAQNSGTDLADILQGGGGLSEAAVRTAIKEVVSELIKPFTEQNEQQRQHQELQQQAHQEYISFLEEYPDANPHQGHIATMMEKSGKPMLESYFMLKTWALQNGLDWSKPLGEQAEALQRRRSNNADPNGDGNNNNRRLPDFNGRTGSDHVVTGDRKAAGADDDWGAIIRSAAAEVAQRRN